MKRNEVPKGTALYANGGVLKVAAGRGTGNLAVAAPAHISTATGTPSCVLRQQTTTLTAKATQVLERNMWYRAVCNRTTTGGVTTVTLTVTRLGEGTAVPAQAGKGPAHPADRPAGPGR
ncbi:hypothetical protein [Archangium lansingense]|uniref:Uncharacterized protein n=1 Tax=Archangium lansingense TaxID=2995310 RepID=A0ABT3ZXZ6_9BACT|nr:hypothetical protein [Archangium lansinium]MCY1074282.1 hypothetical protein [Archangium lansinium]